MPTRISRIWLIIAVVAAFSASATFAEQIDNPMYGYWAKFKPGSVLKTTTESISGEVKMTLDSETTLQAVTPEKVTVEIKTDGKSGDTKLKQRIRKQDIPAKFEKPANTVIKHSTEEITVGGKTYKCLVSEETRETVNIKTWTSEEVPGGVVKAEVKSDGLSVTTLLVEATAKK
jgi:hypothetical protein